MRWQFDDAGIDWNELSHLYRIAPLGDKPMSLISIPIKRTMVGRHRVYES